MKEMEVMIAKPINLKTKEIRKKEKEKILPTQKI